MARSPLLRLFDMRAAIQAAFAMTEGVSKDLLDADTVLHAACMFKILITAEAARDLPQDLLKANPDVDWRGLINMGNLLKHQYFRIETDVVWETIKTDLPILLAAVERMIKVEQASMLEPVG
jgi:uncharacterized protein with HEPN domain